jgi:hypothetical protein
MASFNLTRAELDSLDWHHRQELRSLIKLANNPAAFYRTAAWTLRHAIPTATKKDQKIYQKAAEHFDKLAATHED